MECTEGMNFIQDFNVLNWKNGTVLGEGGAGLKLGNNTKLCLKNRGLNDVEWIQLAQKGTNSNMLSGFIKSGEIFLTLDDCQLHKYRHYLVFCFSLDSFIHSFSILSDDRSKASSKTMPPHTAI